LLSAAHFINDLYGNLLSSLMPYLVLRGTITATAAGFVVLVYLLGSSFMQPAFGLISDRSGRRLFAVLGPLWVGIGATSAGLVNNQGGLLLLAAVSGIGTAAFHPQAASMVNGISGQNKGWVMAIFSMGGNLGFALGPLVAAGIALIGFHWAPAVLVPGVVILLAMVRYAPPPPRSASAPDFRALQRNARRAARPLGVIVTVIATRSSSQVSLIVLLPLFFHAHGLPAEQGSIAAFVLSMSGAVGGLIGGRSSDTYGRKLVVVSSLLLAAPLLFVTVLLTGTILFWPLLALSGALLLASNSVTVVQGQEWLPASTGIASGLTMGVGFGLSGVLASSLTTLSDHAGVTTAVFVVPAITLAAALLGSLIPEAPPALADTLATGSTRAAQ
jgi:FSR family fosmidomycin resistance protein-like MFS transporter